MCPFKKPRAGQVPGNNPDVPPPDPAALLLLHLQVIQHSGATWSDIVDQLFVILVHRLASKYHWIEDQDRVDDAVTQALENYRSHPERYRPEKGTLQVYLLEVCKGCMRDAQRKEKTQHRHETLLAEIAEKFFGTTSPPDANIKVERAEYEEKIRKLLASLSSQDLLFLSTDVRTGGSIEPLAQILDLSNAPVLKAKKAIKNARRRIYRELREGAAALSLEWPAGIAAASMNFFDDLPAEAPRTSTSNASADRAEL